MEVHFYATLRSIVGRKTVLLDIQPGVTARQVVNAVVEMFPGLKAELLDTNNEFYPHQKFFINGRDMIYLEKKLDTVIQPGDRLDFFPPVGGG